MGIYLRYAAALIILATVSDSYAAVRKNVSMPSKQSVIDNPSRSFQTPNGSAAYFGQDYVDYHTAGNRFKPGDSPGAAKQKIAVKPSVTVNPRTAAKAAVKSMRGGVPGVVASAAAAAIVAAVDGIIDSSGAIKVPSVQEFESPPGTQQPGDYYWSHTLTGTNRSTASSACAAAYSSYTTRVRRLSDLVFVCDALRESDNYWMESGTVGLRGSQCPSPSTYDGQKGACVTTSLAEPTDADWAKMEDLASSSTPDFVRDMVRASCQGSTSPSRCFDEMSKWGDLEGPSSATGPAQTTTSVTTNPDGTTSNTATTTQNKYNYTYGDNYYNYSTTTTTTTTKDGQTTTTETSDGLPTDEPTSEENPTDEDQSYTFDDSPMPDVPSFYEQQYPDGLAGVWDNASAQVNSSQFIQFLNGFVPSFSGSCPSFGLSFNIASWASYGSIGFSSLCYVFDFIKVILLVTALFTFRAITFGG